jgi:hypothetical protein
VVERRDKLDRLIAKSSESLRDKERSLILSPDPIERAKLTQEVEGLRRQLFEYRKQLDALTIEAPAGLGTGSAEAEAAKVFVSYTRADRPWVKRLRSHLAPLESEGRVEVWDEGRMEPGTRWRDEIERAIASSAVVIPLVSADYLASSQIVDEVLPLVIGQARTGRTLVLPVIISPSRFARTALAQFQAVNSPSSSLVSKDKDEQEKVFENLGRSVQRYLGHAAAAP